MHLARDLHVSASTQNQAFSAVLFLYREVLKKDLGWLQGSGAGTEPGNAYRWYCRARKSERSSRS